MQFRIHPEGYFLILGALLVSVVVFHFLPFLGFLCFLITAWVVTFFRDPDRMIIQTPGLVLSPADGVIQSICGACLPPELGGDAGYMRISIFLNIFNVHVNRIPIGGRVLKTVYHPGKFINASFDKASTLNERQSTLLEVPLKEGKSIKIAFVQIAGLIARRIVSNVEEGEEVQTGKRCGIIKFGSRVDVYLPEQFAPKVGIGEIAVGGESILADIFCAKQVETSFVKM